MRHRLLISLGLFLVAFPACTASLPKQATGVGNAGATLRGEVLSTAAGEVDYWFKYGQTTVYGQTTPRRTIAVSGDDTYDVAEPVTGLAPDTEYHFQLCVQHHTDQPGSVVCLSDRAFRTDAQAPTQLDISTDPELYPAFSPTVQDYVTRCDDRPVGVDVDAPAANSVAVAGGAAQSGSFAAEVPLRSGQDFDLVVTGTGAGTYHVRCLPNDFPTWTFERTGQPTQALTLLGLTKAAGRFVTFIDGNGTPVWWFRHIRRPLDAKLLADGTVAFARGDRQGFGDENTAYEIRSLDGTLLRTLVAVGSPTDHHDLLPLPNGNYLMMSYKPRDGVDLSEFGLPDDSTVLDAEIQEVTPAGTAVWTWNSKDHVALDESAPWWPAVRNGPARLSDGRTAYDIVHINAFELVGDEGLLVSLRHTDAIYRIRRSDGAVLWKLGGTTRPESLTVVGDSEVSVFSGQHDVRRLTDGTVTIYDNGTQASRPPRALRFAIDTIARTATRLETVSDPEIPNSLCCGSARKLGPGGWLVGWGAITSPVIGEYAPNGAPLFRLGYPEAFSYRAFPVPPGAITADALRQGMDAMAAP